MEDTGDKKLCEEIVDIDGRALSVLPELDYTILLGASIYCFNSCLSFAVELLRSQGYANLNWWKLTDQTAGVICDDVKYHLDDKSYINPKLYDDFNDLCYKRDRIVHSFSITDGETKEQMLQTKIKGTAKNKDEADRQFPITRDYMKKFIKQVLDLNYRLDDVRDLMRFHGDYK